jgi:hypothetical protein
VTLLFFSVRVAILADSLAIALAALDTPAFFAGAFAAGFAAFFAVAIFISFIVFQTTKLFWPGRYSHKELTLANHLLLLALDCADCVKFTEDIAVFHLGYWPVFATKNARLH